MKRTMLLLSFLIFGPYSNTLLAVKDPEALDKSFNKYIEREKKLKRVAEELQIELERSVKACKSFNPRSRKFFEHHWLKSFEPDSNKSIEEIRESCIEHVKEKAKTEKELQEKHASKKRDESLIGFAFYVLRELAEVIKEHSESKK